MNYKVYDVVLGKKLSIEGNEYKLIKRVRLTSTSEDGFSMTRSAFARIVKKIIIESKVVTDDLTPDQVTRAINNYNKFDLDTISLTEIENLYDVLRFFGYDIFVIGRPDLNPDNKEFTDSPLVSYLINNYQDNPISASGLYSGFSLDYDEGRIPLAYDYLDVVSVPVDVRNFVGMSGIEESFDILNARGQINKFDDTTVQEFFKLRSMKFLIFHI